MMYQRNLPVLIIILILANVLAFSRCQTSTYCIDARNFTQNSRYAENLNALLDSLPNNMDANGFYYASRERNTDYQVHVKAICRGDTQPDTCSSCVENLTSAALESCWFSRQVISWSYLCWLRYSDVPIFRSNNYEKMYWEWDIRNVTGDTHMFMSDLMNLLNDLIPHAAGGGKLLKVAVGNRRTSNFQTIYALVQCTPDLSQQDCNSCLVTAAQGLSTCCDAKGNVRVYVASCDLRYGSTLFYNESRILELEHTTNASVSVHVPVAQPSTPSQLDDPRKDRSKDSATTQTLIILVVSAFAGLMIIALIVAFLIRRKRLLSHQASKTRDSDAQSVPIPIPVPATDNADLLQLKFDEIRVATNDFSTKLGKGGFGAVFWGKLPGGREIAVKRLAIGSNQGEREFKSEVGILAQLKHRNLVTLIGFSSEGEEKILVYEYVQNGSLSKFLFDPTERSNLDWNTRYNIIEGIVMGILYLHKDSQLMIVHRDLKPSNILLDGNMDSKIADFGLARLLELDQTHCSTIKIAGTLGYIAPEYQFENQFSMKSDVFSFGVLLLEIISGKRNSRQGNLTIRAWDAWRTSTAETFVAPVLLRDDSSILQAILRYIHIGLLCVQPKAKDRPSITSIVTMLNSPSMILPEPSNSTGFYTDSDTEFHSVESQ